jgi:hypothetical protein
VDDKNEICQRLVMVRTLVPPALIEKIVKLVPLLKLEDRFKLELDDLKVLRYDICLSGATKLVNTFGRSPSELLTMLSSLQIVLQLCLLAAEDFIAYMTYAAFDVILRPS